jgi:erythromycin esterase
VKLSALIMRITLLLLALLLFCSSIATSLAAGQSTPPCEQALSNCTICIDSVADSGDTGGNGFKGASSGRNFHLGSPSVALVTRTAKDIAFRTVPGTFLDWSRSNDGNANIVFSIDASELRTVLDRSSTKEATLTLPIWDADRVGCALNPSCQVEVDRVYFNGHLLDHPPAGTAYPWSTNIFSIDPAWINPGDNTVRAAIRERGSDPAYATIDEWISHEAIPFSVNSSETLNASVDRVVASLDPSVEVLGFGEGLHAGADILLLRNRLFQHLVETQGYSAIAIESSFTRAPVVNEYVMGRGPASYEALKDTGFSHDFGRLDANRELVEWMRAYNSDPSHPVKLRFYGFDTPTDVSSDSPRHVLDVAVKYLASVDSASARKHRERIDPLLGQDAAWESPDVLTDPTKSIGLSPAATALRIETEDLITELRSRGPELVAKSDESRYLEALRYAVIARQLLNYHAALASTSDDRTVDLLDIRDVSMADNLAYIVAREQDRGRVLAFAHNSHLQRGTMQSQLGNDTITWCPMGSHLNEMFGQRYAVIGSGVGVSEANGIVRPEAGTLEARLTAVPGPARWIPTHRGMGLPGSAIAALPIRSGNSKNPSYYPLTPQSVTDFDWLVVLDSTAYDTRGGPPL